MKKPMKEQIFYTARRLFLLPVLMLVSFSGCTDNGGEDEHRTTPKPVRLDLTIALAGRADNATPDYEAIEPGKLRIIIIDNASGLVEYNGLPPVADITTSITNNIRIYTVKDLSSTAGEKKLYALANAENIISEDIRQMRKGQSGDKLISALNKATLSGAIDGYIPMSSLANTVMITAPTAEKTNPTNKAKITMAYAAVKFDFSFKSKVPEITGIIHWSVSSIASKSYLIPHMGMEEWEKLVNPDLGWITKYDIPNDQDLSKSVYTHEYQPYFQLKQDTLEQDPQIYYMHESRNIPDASLNKQQYVLNIGLKTNMEQKNSAIEMAKIFPTLESLVRGTHVKVIVTINSIPISGKNDLEVRVETWKPGDKIEDGEWEEVSPKTETDKTK